MIIIKITMVGITIKKNTQKKPAPAYDGFSQTQRLTGDHTLGLLRNPRRKSLSISRYSFLVLLTVDKMITLLSCPWNSSTLPTLISPSKRLLSIIFWIFCTLPWKENSDKRQGLKDKQLVMRSAGLLDRPGWGSRQFNRWTLIVKILSMMRAKAFTLQCTRKNEETFNYFGELNELKCCLT